MTATVAGLFLWKVYNPGLPAKLSTPLLLLTQNVHLRDPSSHRPARVVLLIFPARHPSATPGLLDLRHCFGGGR